MRGWRGLCGCGGYELLPVSLHRKRSLLCNHEVPMLDGAHVTDSWLLDQRDKVLGLVLADPASPDAPKGTRIFAALTNRFPSFTSRWARRRSHSLCYVSTSGSFPRVVGPSQVPCIPSIQTYSGCFPFSLPSCSSRCVHMFEPPQQIVHSLGVPTSPK